jgi:hypothetical protein
VAMVGRDSEVFGLTPLHNRSFDVQRVFRNLDLSGSNLQQRNFHRVEGCEMSARSAVDWMAVVCRSPLMR